MFEPLTEEEVKRRKQAEDEKNRVKMERLHKKQEKKQKQAGRDYFFFNLKQEVWLVLYSDSVTHIEYSQTFLIWTSIMLPFPVFSCCWFDLITLVANTFGNH